MLPTITTEHTIFCQLQNTMCSYVYGVVEAWIYGSDMCVYIGCST